MFVTSDQLRARVNFSGETYIVARVCPLIWRWQVAQRLGGDGGLAMTKRLAKGAARNALRSRKDAILKARAPSPEATSFESGTATSELPTKGVRALSQNSRPAASSGIEPGPQTEPHPHERSNLNSRRRLNFVKVG